MIQMKILLSRNLSKHAKASLIVLEYIIGNLTEDEMMDLLEMAEEKENNK